MNTLALYTLILEVSMATLLVMISKQDQQTIVSEFNPHWMPLYLWPCATTKLSLFTATKKCSLIQNDCEDIFFVPYIIRNHNYQTDFTLARSGST